MNAATNSGQTIYLLPIFAALGVVIAAAIAAWVALRIQRTTRLVETITSERATWRSDLRKEMADFSSIMLSGLDGKKINLAAFHKARVGILLRINPAGRLQSQPITGGDNLDKTINDRLRSLTRALKFPSSILKVDPMRECILRNLEELEFAVQELLKNEWEVSKQEAMTGKLKKRISAK